MDKVCYFEIPYSDKSRAHHFYQKVFGWQVQDADNTPSPYSFAITTPVDEQFCPHEPGGINGGMYQRGEGASKSPLLVIEVESCEQRMKDVTAAGGETVLGPTRSWEWACMHRSRTVKTTLSVCGSLCRKNNFPTVELRTKLLKSSCYQQQSVWFDYCFARTISWTG